MITVKENTTLVGVSELRTAMDKILKQTKKGVVIIEKRHKPAAVLMSNEQYEHLQNALETAEDLILGLIAQDRYTNSSDDDYVDLKALLKSI